MNSGFKFAKKNIQDQFENKNKKNCLKTNYFQAELYFICSSKIVSNSCR